MQQASCSKVGLFYQANKSLSIVLVPPKPYSVDSDTVICPTIPSGILPWISIDRQGFFFFFFLQAAVGGRTGGCDDKEGHKTLFLKFNI